jgi:hypothetical protein
MGAGCLLSLDSGVPALVDVATDTNDGDADAVSAPVSACGDTGTECSTDLDCDTAGLPEHLCDSGCCIEIVAPENCANGRDDDRDGDTDCDDVDCVGVLACDVVSCGDCPAGTQCVDERGCLALPVTTASYSPSSQWAYVAASYVGQPPLGDSEITEDDVRDGVSQGVCCFDIDGDGFVDNAFGGWIETAGSIIGDNRDVVTEAILAGELVGLVEFRDGFTASGSASIHFFSGTNDVDGNGAVDQSAATRLDGEGEFLVLPGSFGSRGSTAQINRGTWNSVLGLFVGDGEIPFLMPATALVLGSSPADLFIPNGDESELSLFRRSPELRGVRVEADLRFNLPTLTINEFSSELDINLGGLRIGGYVLLDDIFAQLADQVSSCDCAEGTSTGEPPVLEYGEGVGTRPDRYGFRCNNTSFSASGCGTVDDFCQNLNLICSTGVSLLSSLSLGDIDSNGSGINDAMSFGTYLSLVPAEIAAGTFAP